MTARGIIFDLDGTLADTLDTIAAALNDGLASLGLPVHPREAVAAMDGEGVGVLCERGLPTDRRAEAGLHARLMTAVRAAYDAHPMRHARLFDGVAEMVAALADDGVRLAVLSNKPHPLTVATVEGLGVGDRFEVVLGQTDDFPRKPDPSSARWILERLGLAADDVLYVGDTPVDMETARAAGLRSIAVTWGFRSRRELEACAPDHVVEDAAALVALARGGGARTTGRLGGEGRE